MERKRPLPERKVTAEENDAAGESPDEDSGNGESLHALRPMRAVTPTIEQVSDIRKAPHWEQVCNTVPPNGMPFPIRSETC